MAVAPVGGPAGQTDTMKEILKQLQVNRVL